MVCPPMLHRQTGATKCCLSQKLSVRYLVDVTSSQKKEPLHPSLCLSSPKRRTLPNGKEKKRKKTQGYPRTPRYLWKMPHVNNLCSKWLYLSYKGLLTQTHTYPKKRIITRLRLRFVHSISLFFHTPGPLPSNNKRIKIVTTLTTLTFFEANHFGMFHE